MTTSDQDLQFASSVACCITDEDVHSDTDYCSCQHSDDTMLTEIAEENDHLTIICQKCEKMLNLGDENEPLRSDKDNSENLHTDTQVSVCQCGNMDPQKFQSIEQASNFCLYCQCCEKLSVKSKDSAKLEGVLNGYDFCAGQQEDNPLCKACGNQNLEEFDQIDEQNHFLLICKICDTVVTFSDNEESALEQLDLFLDNLQIEEDDDISDSSSNKLLIYHPDAKVVICSVCERMWSFDEESLPVEAEMHTHDEYTCVNNEKEEPVEDNRGMCRKAPGWEKVKSVDLLSMGDHVCFWNGYWRHAIVTLSDKENITLLGYRFKPKCQITEEPFPANKFNFQRAVYKGKTYPPDIVITRARSRLGEERYNVITNYARAFPRWCQTDYGGICSRTPSDLGAFHISQSEAAGQEQVIDVSILKIGDHIKWWRKGFHWHHAVVFNMLKRGRDQFVDVIHYTLMDVPGGIAGKIAKILEKWKWVEVSVERLKWYAEDKKLVSYTGTVGTQFPQVCKKQTKSVSGEIVECSINTTSAGSGKRNVATQVTFSCDSSVEEDTTDSDDESWVDIEVNQKDTDVPDSEDLEESDNSKAPSDPGLLYKVNYSGTTHPVDVILEKAKSRIGQANYLLLKKNCEHFASWCCTGKSSSKQVDSLMEYITKFTGPGLKESLVVVEALLLKVPETAPRVISSAKAVLSKLVRVVPVEAVGMVIFAVIEIIIKSINIYKAWKACNDGKMTKEERNSKIAKEISEGVGSVVVGGLLGFLFGMAIPVPILGNTLGLIIGAVIGHVAGRKIGYKIAESQKQKAIEAADKQKKD